MIAIREFMKTGGAAVNDDQLISMMRARMHMEPLNQRSGWLQEIELLLDAYGTRPQLAAAARMRDVLKQLAGEIRDVMN